MYTVPSNDEMTPAVGRKDSGDSIFSRSSQTWSVIQPAHGSQNKLILHTAPRRGSIDKSSGGVDDNKQQAMLVYKTSFGGKMTFSLIRPETQIGRKEDNHIVLTDGKISKYHAVLIKNEFG